ASIKAAAVQSSDSTGTPIQILPFRSLNELEAFGLALDDQAADTGHLRILLEKLDGGARESLSQSHVSVHETKVPSPAVLKAELCAHATGPIRAVAQADDLDWISASNLDGPVGRGAIG